MKYGRKKKVKKSAAKQNRSHLSINLANNPGFSSTLAPENVTESNEKPPNQNLQLDNVGLSFLENADEHSLLPFESIPQYGDGLSSIGPLDKENTLTYQFK